MNLKHLLAIPYVKRFFLTRFISNLGNGMAPIALAFGILQMPNGSASLLGLVLGANTIATLVIFPFGGVIADRFGRIRMVALTDVMGSLGLIVQASFFATGHVPIWVLLFANINFGLQAGIWWPAFSGILPALLPEEELQKGNAFLSFISNIALISGAALGGVLVTTSGATAALYIDAFSFLIAGAIVSTFRHLVPARSNNEHSMMQDLIHGWKVFLSYRWIVAVVGGFSFIVMAWAGAQEVLGPLISLQRFHGASSWAIVLTAESIGLVTGSLIGYRIVVKHPMRFMMIITWSLSIYIWVLSGSHSLAFIAFTAFLWGITLDLWGTIWTTALVRQVPRESLSRVSAFDGMGSMFFRPLGLLIAGPLAAWLGIIHAMWFFALFSALIVGIVLLVPEVRNMEMPSADSANS
jgi:predicted MFS family arabinose efflux permease